MAFVISGFGTITSLAHDPDLLWRNLMAGKSGVKWRESRTAPYTAPVNLPLPSTYDRSIELALACTGLALENAGKGFALDAETGIFISSTKGGMNSVGIPSGAGFIENVPADAAGRAIARDLDITGPVFNVVAACATGIFALQSAMRSIQAGECQRALVGASESALTDLVLSGFSNMGVLAKCPPRPFTRERDGFAPAEGAAVFAIETKEAALQRNARIWGKIAGIATVSDNEHAVRFDPTGAAITRAILQLFEKTGLAASDIDAICVHGTGTRNNDVCETNGILAAFGKRGREVPCFGVKPSIGHVLGASAAVEMAVCLLALQHNALPPTLGNGTPDPACALNVFSGNIALNQILSLNFGFGGHVGAVCVEKY
ncbi:MAG: hypothetical protein A2268_11005 [Candidatus Raymondbacteria bacterium RifOxyA12_full_50_37]|nr:MAG: hypothetical protein A2268_11005 [Candidatus Raymondbacteria bacterium RifOxyA12_full_50_37]OGJ85539.1 MAG: hypothetical protein A2248_12790 [Candidatus Raymondbacteria bacterium RIFOXYA2_FULL_49_16]OGJ94673.1 MAG: hypothetical protein A2487_08015 [Candidatus Raymondbacteria bacterium RifOxyC12_full_50_8]OGJ95042.1 MAG: hypothetical protein A2453_07490 [Candidatus Raymondbacteria bacterium RIFOXYC2_FULL_50_21]OGP39236.1 MAG: hypothetical protein A2324_09095 [Candidatus Raymondbacteria b